MRKALLAVAFLGLTGSILGLHEVKDYNFEDKPMEDQEGDSEHLTPDINCLLREFPEYFGFPKKSVNPNIEPVGLNRKVDPFIVFLNSQISTRQEGLGPMITIADVNEYFEILDEEFAELREFLDECAKIPKKFSLDIIELNYLYCTIVYKEGFQFFSAKLISKKEYKNAFNRIVENTISEIFDYKTYLRSIAVTPVTKAYWRSFFLNLIQFNDINANYKIYDNATIIEIKTNNFFFNVERSLDLNLWFRFYVNYLSILRALQESYFYMYMKEDFIMDWVKDRCEFFERMIVDELYGSLLYLLMNGDKKFLAELDKAAEKKNFLTDAMEENFEKLANDFNAHIDKEMIKEDNFSIEEALGIPSKPPRELPDYTENPLLNAELSKYRPLRLEAETAYSPEEKTLEPEPVLTTYRKIVNANEAALRVPQEQQKMRDFLRNFKILGEFGGETGRRLAETGNEKAAQVFTDTGRNLRDLTNFGPESHLNDQENIGGERELQDNEAEPFKFQLPSQPDLSNPQGLFDRIDFMKRPLSWRTRRTTLSKFYNKIEQRVREHYGNFANLPLMRLCESYMDTPIRHFGNIFCLILQKESTLLMQQKFGNSKVEAFIHKYFRFITFNFFTYFKLLKENEDLVDIAVLTLFFNEKFFNAVKLAVVSFNNLLFHFEEEFKDHYKVALKHSFMPLLNKFKYSLFEMIYARGEEVTEARLKRFKLNDDVIRVNFLPRFRLALESLVIKPATDEVNLEVLRDQYFKYLNGMNLLSYDRIRKNFEFYSKMTQIKKSSVPPTPECQKILLEDINTAHENVQKGVESSKVKTAEDDEVEYECIKNWKLFDDLFHNIFYDVKNQEVHIKSRVGSPSEENQFKAAMESEMERVVNGFIAHRMKSAIEHFYGEKRDKLETCGVIKNYSQIKCYSIFGEGNCRPVKGTIYYTRRCPNGYTPQGMACSFDCSTVGLENAGEFCKKSEDSKDFPCPAGTFPKDDLFCLKPTKRYFKYISNPFNEKI